MIPSSRPPRQDASLGRADRDALLAATRSLRRFDADLPIDATALASRVASTLHERLHAPSASFRPVRDERGWGFEFLQTQGFSERALREYRAVASRRPVGMFAYDPLRPTLADRNVLRELSPDGAAVSANEVFARTGHGREVQTRVLLCDGPLLLAWVGAFRRSGPNDARDRRIVASVAHAALSAMRIARGFGVHGPRSTLESAFEAYPGEMYLVRRDGTIELANAVGAERLARDGTMVAREVRTAVGSGPAGDSSFEVHEIVVRGAPRHHLVTRRSSSSRATKLERRLEEAAHRWRLSPRQTQVLGRLALGDASKDIGVRLGMGIRTVEQHVAEMMKRARVDSRFRLVADFWRGE